MVDLRAGTVPARSGQHRAGIDLGVGPGGIHESLKFRTPLSELWAGVGIIERVRELTDVDSAFGYGDSLLVGERVRLRGLRDDDLPTLAKWEMDPARQATGSNWVIPASEATAKERLAKWCANDKDDLGFAIETLDDSALVGNIGLWGARPKDRCATIGLGLGREHLGRGYGTDAMRVIVDYAFREMGLHRVQLEVAPFNLAGIRAYEKAGFVEEGRHREAVWHDGRWYDEVMMSILDHEWAGRTHYTEPQ